MLRSLTLILSLGALGVFARYQFGLIGARFLPQSFPWVTFAINITGSFLIGLVSQLGAQQKIFGTDLKLGLMIGLLGGFTTFSAFSLETIRLLENGLWAEGISYCVLSPLLGVGLCYLGIILARQLG